MGTIQRHLHPFDVILLKPNEQMSGGNALICTFRMLSCYLSDLWLSFRSMSDAKRLGTGSEQWTQALCFQPLVFNNPNSNS